MTDWLEREEAVDVVPDLWSRRPVITDIHPALRMPPDDDGQCFYFNMAARNPYVDDPNGVLQEPDSVQDAKRLLMMLPNARLRHSSLNKQRPRATTDSDPVAFVQPSTSGSVHTEFAQKGRSRTVAGPQYSLYPPIQEDAPLQSGSTVRARVSQDSFRGRSPTSETPPEIPHKSPLRSNSSRSSHSGSTPSPRSRALSDPPSADFPPSLTYSASHAESYTLPLRPSISRRSTEAVAETISTRLSRRSPSTSSNDSGNSEQLERTLRWSTDSYRMDSVPPEASPTLRRPGFTKSVSLPYPKATKIRSLLKTRGGGAGSIMSAVKENDHAALTNFLSGFESCKDTISTTDKDGYTPLHWAAQLGHIDIVRLLLIHFADIEALTKSQQRTPLYLAAANGHPDVVHVLLGAGAKVDAFSPMDGATALHKAALCGHDAVMITLLNDHNINVDQRDIEGMPPLMWATQGRRFNAIKLLVARGADLEIRIKRGKNLELASKEGLTVLHKAITNGDAALARIFLEQGADANAVGPFEMYPLHRAAARGDMVLLGILLEFGGDLERRTSEGWTPLHYAARYGHRKCYGLLVREGADEEAKNSQGRTARELGENFERDNVSVDETKNSKKKLARERSLREKYGAIDNMTSSSWGG